MDFQEGEILYFNKPLTWTSFKLVNIVRLNICRALQVKKLKVGHAGTLDPLATGVMIVCTGRATKQIESFQYQTKEYIATLALGATTPSFDLEKEIDHYFDCSHLTPVLIEETLKKFVGTIEQIPPSFSACKVNGKRAYAFAREGQEVELKAKTLVIDELELKELFLPSYPMTLENISDETNKKPYITIRVVCSKGTYIRALARDIGESLGCGAHLTALVRIRVGDIRLEDCQDIEDFKNGLINKGVNAPQTENI